MAQNYKSFVITLLAGIQWARSHYGERLTGTIALLTDTLAEGANQAVKARFDSPYRGHNPPPDALPYIGQNKNIERYIADTDITYKGRLLQAFSLWSQAGTKQAVLRALAAYGQPLAQLYEDKDWARPPKPYWSQFWILFPSGTHTVTPGTETFGGGATYGSGVVYGASGITADEVDALRRLVKKWKRSASICREFIFEGVGSSYGGGPTYGDGTLFGGESAVIGGG